MEIENLMSIIVLISPKFEENVANVLRAAANLKAKKVIVVRRRYKPATGVKGDRIPRPLRMKVYSHIPVEYVDSFEWPKDNTDVVVVEKLSWATPLQHYKHSQNTYYIFGPEDGNVPKYIMDKAKKFVTIESVECLNLSMVTGIVLYARNAYLQTVDNIS